MSIFDTPTPDLGTPSTEGVAAPVETPAVETPAIEVPAPEGVEAPPAEPQARYLDLDEYGDHLVKIKVDGEERELPFSRVRDGLMMQEAFTKRTQELAEERNRLYQAEALVAALEQNPHEIIRQLAEANDLDVNGLQPVERTPEEAAFRAQQQQLTQARAQMAQAQINSEIAEIRAKFGDFDVVATAQFARENQIPLPMAHRIMRADQQEAAAAQAAETERRRQAALAAQSAHQGGGAQAGSVTAPKAPAGSVREAYMAAKAAHSN